MTDQLREAVKRAIRDCEPKRYAHESEPKLQEDDLIDAVDAVFDELGEGE